MFSHCFTGSVSTLTVVFALAIPGGVSADVVFMEDFESADTSGGNATMAQITVTGGYNAPNIIGNFATNLPQSSNFIFLDTDFFFTDDVPSPVSTEVLYTPDPAVVALPGYSYTLMFEAAGNFGAPGPLTYALLVDGVEVATNTVDLNVGPVVPISFSGASGAIAISLVGEATAGGYGQIQIDNITIDEVAVPEPAGFVLLASGLALVRRRRS
ncbi:hypothetical protein Pan265_03150 [Mucisphaera calidilacus]|uniref:PEP-CTERM protein-sorting domain-containing protein n=2 Tax=Mucisphaera calidilacus TaxID=2527982 RepID=A0A518BU78_9BACT|nr:hypothetical protein Pan265_03150 [Mucisphaera calidilacus]